MSRPEQASRYFICLLLKVPKRSVCTVLQQPTVLFDMIVASKGALRVGHEQAETACSGVWICIYS